MTAKTEPNSGLSYGWALGEDNWNTGMDANLLQLGRVGGHLIVINRTTTTPPASPADGDVYLVGTGATGAWAGKDDNVAVWDATAAAWTFYVPKAGWLAYDAGAAEYVTYSGAWTALIPAVSTPPYTVLDSTLTAPPASPVSGDKHIVGASATGAWAGKGNNVATYNGTSWDFTTPATGWTTYDQGQAKWIGWNGTAWVAV